MENSSQYHPSLLPEKIAVTLVAHGLNLKPEAMLSLVRWLNLQGADVVLVSLSGHYKGGVEITEVTSAIWKKEMQDSYKAAKEIADKALAPLYFLGYSLGALLGQSMIALSMKETPFNKQVLLAPAIAIRSHSYLLQLLFLFGKKWRVPSFTPEGYRFNPSLPLLIYQMLFKEEKRVIKSAFKQLNIPTLVILDPKDELISYKKLLKQISQFNLTQFKVIALDAKLKGRSKKYHHLIVDEQTMGKKNWQMATAEIKKFLFATSL